MMISTSLDDIFHRFQDKLSNLESHAWMNEEKLQEFALAIHRKGAPLSNCWAFVDGTARGICRPSQYQRLCFSGHKRIHCIKFQSLVTPNGLIINLFGPMEGRRHDAALLRESNLLVSLENLDFRLNDEARTPMCIYGDPAYPIRRMLIAPYRSADLSADQKLFNTKMSAVRQSVEWQFGKLVNLFSFLDFKKNLKLFLQPVAKYYMVGAILANCHTCLYGSQTSTFFGVDPPELEEYLS